MLRRVKAWYSQQKGECWFAATMMLEFAMRNGDVLRLRKENFVTKGEREDVKHFLDYTPHKTELSSGRWVNWREVSDTLRQLYSSSSMRCCGIPKQVMDWTGRGLVNYRQNERNDADFTQLNKQ